MYLVRLSEEHLPSCVEALERGWSSNNGRGLVATEEELDLIESDPRSFLELMDDTKSKRPMVTMPDGSTVPRLPGFRQ